MIYNDKILIATRNKNKFIEFQDIIKNNPAGEKFFADGIIYAPDFGNLIVEETGHNYFENALLKAQAWSKISNMAALADDSGLEVEALDNAPGLFSNRIIPNGNDAQKIEWLLNNLQAHENRNARFVAALALVLPDGRIFKGEGFCYGRIAEKVSGVGGFGYDPVFIPDEFCGKNLTFAEIPAHEKNLISHRANAFKNLLDNIII